MTTNNPTPQPAGEGGAPEPQRDTIRQAVEAADSLIVKLYDEDVIPPLMQYEVDSVRGKLHKALKDNTAYADGYYDGLRQGRQLARATQPATAPSDERFMVHEPTGTVECNDSRCPVGATIIGWPHPLSTPTCIYAATVATPTDVAERARQAAQKIWNNIDRSWTVDELIEIIAAEFGGETK